MAATRLSTTDISGPPSGGAMVTFPEVRILLLAKYVNILDLHGTLNLQALRQTGQTAVHAPRSPLPRVPTSRSSTRASLFLQKRPWRHLPVPSPPTRPQDSTPGKERTNVTRTRGKMQGCQRALTRMFLFCTLGVLLSCSAHDCNRIFFNVFGASSILLASYVDLPLRLPYAS